MGKPVFVNGFCIVRLTEENLSVVSDLSWQGIILCGTMLLRKKR